MPKRELVLPIKKLPANVRLLCGDLPVLRSEKRKEYESLFCHMADCVEPANFIEWLLLKDMVDHTWEIRRLRRFKKQLIEPEVPVERFADSMEAIREAIWKAKVRSPEEIEERLENRKKEIAGTRAAELKKRKRRKPSEADTVKSFRQRIDEYQALDRLLISAEDRRNAVLREIDRRRDGLAQRMRRASDDVIDAEFTQTSIAAE